MRWRILALLFLARIGLGFQFQTMGSVGDSLGVAFGLDYAQIGWLIGLFMVPGLFLAIPAGFWGRYVTDRVMVVVGLGLLALGGVVCAAAPSPWVVGLGRLFAGAGFLFANVYSTKMVADWFDGREMATAMGIFVMSWPMGIAMGQVGHVWLAELFGWRVPFLVAALYCLVASVGVINLYRPRADLPPAATLGGARLTGLEWRLLLCAAGAWAVFNAGYVIYLSFGPILLEGLGHSTIVAAGLTSAGSWVMILSGALCGLIADRFGYRTFIITICMCGGILALYLLSLPGFGLGASLLFGLVGIAPAGVIMALAGQAVAPERRAMGMGIFFEIYYLIMTIMPPFAGALLDATGLAPWPRSYWAWHFLHRSCR